MQSTLSGFLSTAEPLTHFVLHEHDAVFVSQSSAPNVGGVILRIGGRTRMMLHLHRAVMMNSSPMERRPVCSDVPLLISMLQKAVRRGRSDVAVAVAHELCHIDPLALVRRLPIIAVEDVDAKDGSLTRAVWLCLFLSVSPSEACLTEDDARWLIGYAGALAESRAYDARFREGPVPSAITVWKRASRIQDHLSLSLVCRASFGGMTGDMDMLHRAAATDLRDVSSVSPLALCDPIRRLTPSVALLEAVDFHCAPFMLQVLTSKVPHAKEDDIKRAMWHNSSKYNVRDPDPHPPYRELWDAISGFVVDLQRNRIRRACS